MVDGEMFNCTVSTLSLIVEKRVSEQTQAILRDNGIPLLDLHNVVRVWPNPENDEEDCILLAEDVTEEAIQAVLDPTELHGNYRLKPNFEFSVNFSNFTFSAAVDKILPPEMPRPPDFLTIGHIAHIDLLPEHRRYRVAIANILLDKYPRLVSVVTATSDERNEYGVRELDIIGGKHKMITSVMVAGCRLKFNYRSIFWDHTLADEYAVLVNDISGQRVVADVCSGFGTVSIPLLKAGHTVYSNDPNPTVDRFIQENASQNAPEAVDKGRFISHNMPPPDFIRHILAAGHPITDFIVYLPHPATDVLEAFIGAFTPDASMPTVHILLPASVLPHVDHTDKAFVDEGGRRVQTALGIGPTSTRPDVTVETTGRVVKVLGDDDRLVLVNFAVPAEVAIADDVEIATG